jgi:hypothetical protein
VVVVDGSTKRQRMTSAVEGSISARPNVKKNKRLPVFAVGGGGL